MDAGSKPTNELQKRARRVPLLIRLPLIIGSLGLAFYWIFTETGVYRYLAEWQASFLNGEHYIMVSGAFTFLITLIPSVAIVHLLASFYPPKSSENE